MSKHYRTRMEERRLLIVSIVLASLTSWSCYSFTGSSIPAHIHTIGIPVAEDLSGFGQSDLKQNITDLLVQKFTTEGSLRVASKSNADALLEVTIDQSIRDDAVSTRVGEQVTTKRVTIHVNVAYRDQKKQKLFWEQGFSQSGDYQLSQNLAGQKAALRSAEDKLTDEILIRAISDW